jgi:uncharacterized membrane protein
MSKEPSYWFEAKTYGIGWTLPVTWQGWLTVLLFVVALLSGFLFISSLMFRFVYILLLAVGLVVVVVWKGEKPPRWRWGRK